MADIEAHHKAECQHDGEKELRVYTAQNGAQHYRPQCLTCGAAAGQSIPKSRVDGGSLQRFDEALLQQHRAARKAMYDDIIRTHIKAQKEANARLSSDYTDYIASDIWAAKRRKVMERAGNLCEGCREATATEVHHLTYDHLFDEFLFELVALCHACHAKWHGEDEAGEHDEDEEMR